MDNNLDNIKETLTERLQWLPQNLYNALFGAQLKQNLHTLTDLLSIPEEEKVLVENNLIFLLLMFLPVDLFVSETTKETSLSEDQAKNVLTQFLNSLPSDVQSDLKLISEDLLAAYEDSPEAASAIKKNSLTHLQQNFQSLREEALQTSTQEVAQEVTPTPQAAAPENLPIGTPDTPVTVTAQEVAEVPMSEETPTIQVPKAVTKTSYTVEPMRTMGGDVTRIHGYGAYRDLFPEEAGEQEYKEEVIKSASQEDILQEKPQLTEKPTYGEG